MKVYIDITLEILKASRMVALSNIFLHLKIFWDTYILLNRVWKICFSFFQGKKLMEFFYILHCLAYAVELATSWTGVWENMIIASFVHSNLIQVIYM